jgi:hypothetical protein
LLPKTQTKPEEFKKPKALTPSSSLGIDTELTKIIPGFQSTLPTTDRVKVEHELKRWEKE